MSVVFFIDYHEFIENSVTSGRCVATIKRERRGEDITDKITEFHQRGHALKTRRALNGVCRNIPLTTLESEKASI